jgi:hypothetical protein
MKLQPPRVEIDEKEPFKEALYGRKDFAESLTSLLKNVTDDLVVFVNAPWGEGKTTFARMWRASLKAQDLESIYFDAYAADYFDDPFVSFSGEILSLVDKRLRKAAGLDEPRTEFKKTAIEVGKRLAGLAVKVGVKAATMGAVDATHLAELKEIGSDLASGVSEITSDVIEKKIENYTAEKETLKNFKESLAKLAAYVRKEQGFPLTIIVDELDRCRPDFALSLLERIKHLFDVEGVTFVLLVNQGQIESYVRTIYGQSVDAPAYLLKFANLFVDLPTQQPRHRHEQGRVEYSQRLIEHYGIGELVNDKSVLQRVVYSVIGHFGPTLREIEKTFTLATLYYGSLPKGWFSNDFLVLLLATLKVKQPTLYDKLRRGVVTVAEFLQQTSLEQIKNEGGMGVDPDWLLNMVRHLLMSEAEFQELRKKASENGGGYQVSPFDGWLSPYNLSRNAAIPLICSRLDRFSLAPKV